MESHLHELVNQPWIEEAEIDLEQGALIEAWLDRLLVRILSLAAASCQPALPVHGESGLKRSGLDRKKLTEVGLEPREVDSLYRGLHLHSISMFRMVRGMSLDQETEQKVMAAFKLLSSYLPKLEEEPYMSLGPVPAKTKLEVSYMQLVQKIEIEKFDWKKEKEDFHSRIRELERTVAEQDKELKALEQALSQRSVELEKWGKELRDTKMANDALKAVMIRHEEELMRLHEECPDDVKELVRLREENEKAAKRLADTERNLRITIDKLEDAAYNAAELSKVKEENEKIAGKLTFTDKELEARTKSLASANETVEKLERENYALTELYHEEATRCAVLRLRVQEFEDGSELEVLRARVQELLSENEKVRAVLNERSENAERLKAEIEVLRSGLRLEKEVLEGAKDISEKRICDLESERESCRMSLLILENDLRSYVGKPATMERQELKELVESIKENNVQLLKHELKEQVTDKDRVRDAGSDHDLNAENESVSKPLWKSQELNASAEIIIDDKLEKACQFMEEDICVGSKTKYRKKEFEMGYVQENIMDLNEKITSVASLDALEVLKQKLQTSKLTLEGEAKLRRNLEEKVNKSAEHVRSLEVAYQEVMLSSQALKSELDTAKLNLQSTTSNVSLLKFELQEEKKAHGQTMSSLSALKTERMNDMERHSKNMDDLTRHFMLALEDEKAARSKTQVHLSQSLETIQHQAKSFKEQEETLKADMQNHRKQISVIVKEFQDTVSIFFSGIDSVMKLLENDGEAEKQPDKETGAFWKTLEVLVEALLSIVREGDGTLLERIKDIKVIAEEKTAEMVQKTSRIVPDLWQRLQVLEEERKAMKTSISKLEEQVAVSGPSMKSLAKHLWISCYGAEQSAKATHGIITEIVRSTLELWKGLDKDVTDNEDCSIKYSRVIRGLEEAKARLELQLDGCSLLWKAVRELYYNTTGVQLTHETENPFASLDATSFLRDVAKPLQGEEGSMKERLDLELEVTRLKAKLKSEQVARIWRDKYIRDLVNKYNAQFDGSTSR